MRAHGIEWLLVTLLLAAGGCSDKGSWVLGQWLLLDEDGKPGVCHEFKKDKILTVYTSAECGGDQDQVSSGRWEAKEENKFAIIRYNERKGQMVMVTEKDAQRFVARGGLAGTLFKVGAKGSGEVLAELERKGLIKVKPLDPALGCRQIALPLKDIRALPAEPEPRMLRHKDQGLKFYANRNSSDPRIEKTVYALNDESLEWVALHLAAPAFTPPGPQVTLETSLGEATDQVATGQGAGRQHIAIWKSYCALTRDTPKRDIDVTMFATAGQKRGTIYVSDNVVQSLWEELKATVQDPANQSPEEESEPEAAEPPARPEEKVAAPPREEPKPVAKPAAPKAEPKPAPKPAPASDDDDI